MPLALPASFYDSAQKRGQLPPLFPYFQNKRPVGNWMLTSDH